MRGDKGLLHSLVHRFSYAEIALVGFLALWAAAPLAALLYRGASTGEVFTGANGLFAADQLQYMAWIRQFGAIDLAANRFSLGPSDEVFLHPMFLLSGLVWRFGGSIQLAYLVWTPLAVVVLFAGFRAYVHRLHRDRKSRDVTLALALFFVTPSALAAAAGLSGTEPVASLAGELFAAGQTWGYLPTVIAIGLMPIFLLGIEWLVDTEPLEAGSRGRRYTAGTAMAGLLVSWLHPWQGETLLVIVGGLVAWRGGRRRDMTVVAAPTFATVLPLLYYLALSRTDPAWGVAQAQTELGGFPPWVVALALAPLAVPALAAVGGPLDTQERMLRLWPPAALLVYLVLSPSVPAHAFEALSLPLAVLAVRGWKRFSVPRWVSAFAVTIAVVPGMAYVGLALAGSIQARAQPHLLLAGEANALRALDQDPRLGGVLPTAYLGSAVPAFSGRSSWVGHPSWTPDFLHRARLADDLFDGALTGHEGRKFVRSTGAAFLLSDCRDREDLEITLGPAAVTRRSFGCAAVYEVNHSRPDAGVSR